MRNTEISGSSTCMEGKHAMDCKLVLLNQASNKQKLTKGENIPVAKNKYLVILFEILLADQLTRKFILNPVGGSRLLLQGIQFHNIRSWIENEDVYL